MTSPGLIFGTEPLAQQWRAIKRYQARNFALIYPGCLAVIFQLCPTARLDPTA